MPQTEWKPGDRVFICIDHSSVEPAEVLQVGWKIRLHRPGRDSTDVRPPGQVYLTRKDAIKSEIARLRRLVKAREKKVVSLLMEIDAMRRQESDFERCLAGE